MKRKILIALTTLVLCGISFLYYSNKKIEGTWISNYYVHNSTGNNWYSGTPVLEIKNQTFNSYYFDSKGVPYKQDYFSFGKSLSLKPRPIEDNSKLRIEKYDKDSLIFGGFSSNEIFKKVPDSLKNSPNFSLNLQNKAFILKSNEKKADTIYFTDKYLMSRLKNNPNQNWTSGGWEKLEIDGFDFLLTADWTTFIVKEKSNKIFFYAFENAKGKNQLAKLELKEIEIDLTDIEKDIKLIERKIEEERHVE